MVALLLGLIRPTWVLPSRRATRVQVFLLYSAAGALVLLLAGGTPQRSAHAQISNPPADSPADSPANSPADSPSPLAPGSPTEAMPPASGARPLTTTSVGSSGHEAGLGEQEPAPESLRDLASRMLLDLGLGSGRRLRLGRLTLAYEDSISEEQAAALGDFLRRVDVGSGLGGAGAGADHGHVQIYLRRSSAATGYELRIATPFSHRSELDGETKAAYQLIGLIASGLAFDGAPVFVHICTPLLRPLLVLRPQLG
ncbi:MAG TPA: hypothetical protein PLW65_07530 [Pseudomonadota bacterium]|nr:hypothetical protein [Pseudomonadota bacterium]